MWSRILEVRPLIASVTLYVRVRDCQYKLERHFTNTLSMATSKIVGYECKFDPFFDSYEYFCKQCKHLAREATTTKCCEKTFCKECIETIIHEKKVCPSCQKDIPGSKPTYQAKILALEVRCSKGHDDTGSRTSMWNMYRCIFPHFRKKVEGCEWKGKIKDLDAHTGDCVYVDMECPNGCGQKVQKCNEETHLAKECPNRALKELELRFQKFQDEQQALQDRQGEQDTELVQRVDDIATKLQKQQQKSQDQQQEQQGVHERKSQDFQEKLVQRVEKIEVDATKLQKQQQKFQDQQQQQQGVHERKSQDFQEKLVQRVEKIEVDATKLQKQQQKFQDQQQEQQGVHERKSQDFQEKLVQRVEKIEVVATKFQEQQQTFQDQQQDEMKIQDLVQTVEKLEPRDRQNSFETEVPSEQQGEFQRHKELTDTQHQTSRAENKGTNNRLHTHSSRFGLTKSEIIYFNYQKHKTNNTTIDSPSLELETDHRKYLYFLKLHPNGTEGGADPHLSLEISPDRKYQPNYPSSIEVTITLLNQHGDQDNITGVMKYESIKKSGIPERGMTATKFISLPDLEWKYLKDDCLKFKIVKQQFTA